MVFWFSGFSTFFNNFLKKDKRRLRPHVIVLRIELVIDGKEVSSIFWKTRGKTTFKLFLKKNTNFGSFEFSEESKTVTQRLGYSPLFRKKYPRTSLQIGQFLRGSTFSSAFLNDASILDLFSSSVNKFISKFQKLLSPSTPGWTLPPFSPKRLRGNYWYCQLLLFLSHFYCFTHIDKFLLFIFLHSHNITCYFQGNAFWLEIEWLALSLYLIFLRGLVELLLLYC